MDQNRSKWINMDSETDSEIDSETVLKQILKWIQKWIEDDRELLQKRVKQY